jgi:23S rRNA (pseudouridine1915-N3)-methyltransferase
MKIQIISIGKLSGDINNIASRYQKMITWNINHHELANSKKTTPVEIKQDEARLIKAKLKPGSYLIALDPNGLQMSSEKFSLILSKQMMQSANIDFIIGGAFGLDDSILKSSGLKLSLSEMTFPHQLAKMLLLEQIYRAQTILNNHPYHK